MSKIVYIQVKTLISRIFALIFLLPFSLLIVIFSLIILLDGDGSPIYTQERIGLNGKPFNIYKLRSMHLNAEAEGAQWTEANDPRVTKIGKFLRKTKLDELPQIFNLLKGDMNIIGPRPERKVFIDQFVKVLPDFNDRLQVKPGITGLAQVNGGYDLSIHDKLKYDQEYIKNFGLWMDVKIFLKTFIVLFTGHGVR